MPDVASLELISLLQRLTYRSLTCCCMQGLAEQQKTQSTRALPAPVTPTLSTPGSVRALTWADSPSGSPARRALVPHQRSAGGSGS